MTSIIPLLLTLYWNAARGYTPFSHATPEGIVISNTGHQPVADSCLLPETFHDFTLTFRASSSGRHPAWGFSLTPKDGEKLWITVCDIESAGPLSSQAAKKITVSFESIPESAKEIILSDGVDVHHGDNIWSVTASDKEITLSAGNHGLQRIATIPCPDFTCQSFGFTAAPQTSLSVSDISISGNEAITAMIPGIWSDPELLDRHLRESSDPIEGIWLMFDRTLEETLLRPGGDYELAIVKDSDRYAIIYLDGAKTNSRRWERGMIKGFLYPLPYDGIFKATWIDAEGRPMSHDLRAQTGEGETLTIQFPYQDSSIRLRKISLKKDRK